MAEEEVLYLENSRDMKFLDVGGDFFVLTLSLYWRSVPQIGRLWRDVALDV